jgi:hypothetical protein
LIDARVDQIQMDLEIASSYPAERENMVAKASEILKEIRFIVYSCFR